MKEEKSKIIPVDTNEALFYCTICGTYLNAKEKETHSCCGYCDNRPRDKRISCILGWLGCKGELFKKINEQEAVINPKDRKEMPDSEYLESFIKLGEKLSSPDKKERESAFFELIRTLTSMDRVEEFRQEIEKGIDRERFFVFILLKQLLGMIIKNIAELYDYTEEIIKKYNLGFVPNMLQNLENSLGYFLLDFFRDNSFSIKHISDVITTFYSIVIKMNDEKVRILN